MKKFFSKDQSKKKNTQSTRQTPPVLEIQYDQQPGTSSGVISGNDNKRARSYLFAQRLNQQVNKDTKITRHTKETLYQQKNEAKIENKELKEIEKIKMTNNNRGGEQSKWRKELFKIITDKGETPCCLITKIENQALLEACHIKPHRNCEYLEKWDPYNGLLLSPNCHKLFDLGLITFDNDGTLLLSQLLTKKEKNNDLKNIFPNIDNIDNFKITLNKNQNYYMKYHREKIFCEFEIEVDKKQWPSKIKSIFEKNNVGFTVEYIYIKNDFIKKINNEEWSNLYNIANHSLQDLSNSLNKLLKKYEITYYINNYDNLEFELNFNEEKIDKICWSDKIRSWIKDEIFKILLMQKVLYSTKNDFSKIIKDAKNNTIGQPKEIYNYHDSDNFEKHKVGVVIINRYDEIIEQKQSNLFYFDVESLSGSDDDEEYIDVIMGSSSDDDKQEKTENENQFQRFNNQMWQEIGIKYTGKVHNDKSFININNFEMNASRITKEKLLKNQKYQKINLLPERIVMTLGSKLETDIQKIKTDLVKIFNDELQKQNIKTEEELILRNNFIEFQQFLLQKKINEIESDSSMDIEEYDNENIEIEEENGLNSSSHFATFANALSTVNQDYEEYKKNNAWIQNQIAYEKIGMNYTLNDQKELTRNFNINILEQEIKKSNKTEDDIKKEIHKKTVNHFKKTEVIINQLKEILAKEKHQELSNKNQLFLL